MKKQSRLAVLLAAVLAIVTLFTGVAFATAATELNATREELDAALSAEEVQAEVAYQQLLECTTVQEMYAALFEGEEALFPVLYYMNQEQLNGAYSHALAIYNPETDDADFYEMVCDSFIIVAEDNAIELLGSGEIFDDYTISGNSDAINSPVTIANNDNGGEANWSFNNGTLTINATVTIPEGQSLDILVANGDSDDKGKIVAGSALGNNPMFIVEGRLKIAKTANNDGQNYGEIEINGGTIQVNSGGTLEMEDITTVSGTAIWDFAAGSKVEIYGDVPVSGALTIKGKADSHINIIRRVADSPLFNVKNGASLTLNDVDIDGADTEVQKAVIETQANTSLPNSETIVTVKNATFKNCNNVSKSGSGAISISGYSKFNLTVDGCTFDDCRSVSGAGIYFIGYANGTASITNSTFQNCTTDEGGAIRTNGNGGVVATVEQCVFKNNKATNPASGDSHGGAIYWNACGKRADGTTAKMFIYDCQFIGNAAKAYAGAVFNESFMEIGTKYTSGFTTTETAPGNIRGTLIKGNSARYGGGVEVPTYGGGAEPHEGTGADLTLNTGVFIIGNTAEYGGGLAMRVGKGTVGDNNSGSTVKFEINIDGAVIRDNKASVMGGGIYLDRMEGHDEYPSTVNLNYGTITGNTAPKGGAVCVYNENQAPSKKTNEVNIGSNAGTLLVENNTATDVGGAIYISYGDVKMHNGTVQHNSAKNGGAIAIDNGQFEMSGGTLLDNEAATNGGAVNVLGGDFTMNGGTIGGEGKGNTATTNGGAVYVTGGSFKMTDGSITYNSANNNGGAVYVDGNNVQFEMDNGSITHNSASENGGAVYMANGNFIMHHGTVDNNSATNGGAVYMAGATAQFTMESGSMSDNHAIEKSSGDGSGDGGAIYANSGDLYIGVMNCTGSDVDVDDDGNATIKSENKDVHHIGVHNNCGEECSHPLIQGNTASDSGGAIAIAGEGKVYLYCGNAINNKALYKGVGMNVFMDGGEFYYYSGANVGRPRDPDLVIVGGTLNNMTNGEFVKLYYYATNDNTSPDLTGMAKPNAYINLPDAEYFWADSEDKPENTRFFGWTAKGTESGDAAKNVRNKSDYVPSGTAVEVLDAAINSEGKAQVIWDGAEDGTIHLYALWAPETSEITYVERVWDYTHATANEPVKVNSYNPLTYNISETGQVIDVAATAKPGYELTGWYIYQDEGQDANWGYEPKYIPVDAEKTYGNLDYSETGIQKLEATNNGLALTVDPLTFGDITLIAEWKELPAIITYQVVGPNNELNVGGYFDLTTKVTTVTETVGQATGNPAGAAAIADYPNYKFFDWYTDEGCSNEADNGWIIDQKLTPQKTKINPNDASETALYHSATYYAKFVYNVADLTIIKEGLQDGDSAIFTVEGYKADDPDDDPTTWKIVLTAGDNKAVINDLRITSNYTIIEEIDWAVYYENRPVITDSVKEFEANGDNPNKVTITNTHISPDKWLHDESAVDNVFGIPSTGN